ncbi:hypothetical protein E2C01_023879 [Portunus trituberculatus]|uniref:Uncharacterized protein n=1 Tax=Portunus trituberculatus TaxID=210409 RepID=A0A5B7E9A8_PORTR|nr:hypothetical protein [Portunus trituberculatus]
MNIETRHVLKRLTLSSKMKENKNENSNSTIKHNKNANFAIQRDNRNLT